MSVAKKWFILPVLALIAGCSTIPERELENAFIYQRQKRYDLLDAKPIRSEFLDLAEKAWLQKKQGGATEYISILEQGDDALLARVHMIRSAKQTIDLQTFIWRDDASSRFVFDELVKAAERGVRVRVLIDGLNQTATPSELARMARAHRNLQICLYKPIKDRIEVGRIGVWESLVFKTKHINRRMHNKLLLVDGHVGIAGGRNYQDAYFDRDPSFLFRDRDVLVAGPAVMDMQDSYELFWQDKRAVFLTQMTDVQEEFAKLSNGGRPFSLPEEAWMFERLNGLANRYSLSKERESLRIYEVDRIKFAYDTPRKFKGSKERMDFDEYFEVVLSDCEDRLIYQTPYLIYSREQRKAFKQIRKDHPKFRIMASSNSLAAADHLSVYSLSFKHRKELYKKTGIDIYEAKPHPADRKGYIYDYDELLKRTNTEKEPILCIHAKSFVLDGKIALIGSHNFDPRSSNLNTECGVFIEDEEVALELEKRILRACMPDNAWTVSKGPKTPVISHFSGIIGGISTALPIFDIWPYRYTTNYELKEGCDPLSPRDPNFQQNYIDVGYFPEVAETSRVIQTRLMKAFFGWARPLM